VVFASKKTERLGGLRLAMKRSVRCAAGIVVGCGRTLAQRWPVVNRETKYGS
jgi:hypothetical protein